jgi:amino acid transporter
MAEAKKFGTFAGVFTPSILSILGVIMYLRLGWVVGEAGLINALAIILLAHVISVSTGLSISSIATDKKIKGGGIYYMLSRSLGLPMGGAIGIIIFIATSLSIALYLIGFAENFLGVEAIRDFFKLGNTINDIRIVGTAAILILVIIAFISTSLAIKSQFIVFGAIILSLIAIFTGLFLNVDIRPDTPVLNPRPDGLPLEAVFAIFFPAVTGFTVGVAMSGDLKDPGKSIPKGTMLAILAGFIIYISLAVSFGLMVNRDLLLSDYNFLSNIALWAPLVIAGVWAATLSSGLGGILGAPRIMQRLAMDKITPRFLAKSTGINNEPRNALLLTFFIAQVAILIGELNIVARIATMFYIAAYGFINLSYTLESWASPDFRPRFKIPKWVSITGFLACFGIMFKMDAIAMIMAVVAMFLVYLYLSKKDLRLDYGDVWQSVWSSVVRSSLNRIARKGIEERNWQPNIVLFSGGSSARPHLIEFGKQLIGYQGLLSNFDLIQTDKDETVIPRQKQIVDQDDEIRVQGFFSKKHYCADIYEGIKTIASIYGFSGIEPNTVMLGWARQSQKPVKFIQVINYIKALDLNILLMDYDKNNGFGKYSRIDIWWRTTEHNGNLGLLLLKFLWLSDQWRNAKARILIVNPINDQKQIIYQNTKEIIEHLRINAEIKVINNQIDQRSFYDIVQVESVSSDLIFIGLPEIEQGKEEDFVKETNALCRDIGTVVLIKASTTFKKLNIGIKTVFINQMESIVISQPAARPSSIPIPEIDLPDKPEISHQIVILQSKLTSRADDLNQTYISKLFSYQKNLKAQIDKTVERHFENLQKRLHLSGSDNYRQAVCTYNTNLWLRFRRLIADYSAEVSVMQINTLGECLASYRTFIDSIVADSPANLNIRLTKESLILSSDDPLMDRLYKIKHLLKIKVSGKQESAANLRYRKILSVYLESASNRMLFEMLDMWGKMSTTFLNSVKTTFNEALKIIIELENNVTQDDEGEKLLTQKNVEILRKTGEIEKIISDNNMAMTESLLASVSSVIALFTDEFRAVRSGFSTYRRLNTGGSKSALRAYIEGLPLKWQSNQKLISNAIMLELGLISLVSKMKVVFYNSGNEIENTFEEQIIGKQLEIKLLLNDFIQKAHADIKTAFNLKKIPEIEPQTVVQTLFNHLMQQTLNKIKQAARLLPDKVELMDQGTLNSLHKTQFKNVETTDILVSRLIDFMFQSEFADPVQRTLDDISAKLLNIKFSTNEIIRSLDFRLNPDSEVQSGKRLTAKEIEQIVVAHLGQLDQEIEKTRQLKSTLTKMFSQRMNTFEDKLTFYAFIENANNLKDFVRQREIIKGRRWMRKMQRNVKLFAQRQLNQFWYRRSSGMLFTQKLKAQSGQGRFSVNTSRNILDTLSIKPQVEEKIPFYYKQLFVRKQYYLNEFWTGREKELDDAGLAIQRFRAGLNGAILVTGDHHSGKTFFSQYAVNKYYPDAQIFTLTPPYAGSTDVNLFRRSLENVFEISGSYYKIFNSLPENSVLIVDDLALWWEQTNQGFAVMAQLIELIEKYSRRCLFVLNVNRYSFGLMRKMNPIENYFISIIELKPQTAEELQQVVLKRHKSGNLKLRMFNRLRDQLRPWDYAKLFAKYYSVSGGNVGVALQSWLANIEDVGNGIIYIRAPHLPDVAILDVMKSDWYLLIIQIILHKRANLRKLSRILRENVQDVKETIDMLLRSGIIEEKNPGVYELNMLFYPFILRKLTEKEMI